MTCQSCLHLITIVTLGEEYKLRSSLNYYCMILFHPHATPSLSFSLSLSLLGPNILLTALLAQYVNLGRFIENSMQDSHS